jgi:hypothetical protein
MPKPQPMRPSALHAKTTTNVPGSNSPFLEEDGGLTKRQGKGGEGRGLGCMVWKYIVYRVKIELNYMKGEI